MSERVNTYEAVLGLIGFILILITHLVRPYLIYVSQEIIFIFGILPNLAAAFSLPYILNIVINQILHIKISIMQNPYKFGLLVMFTIIILIGWEYFQNIVWEYPVDPYDIIFTFLGGILAICIYFIVQIIIKSEKEMPSN
jgi:hypothetical protein